MAKKVVKICIGSWGNASRDKRELSVCREMGADVFVLAKGKEEDRGRVEEVAGYEVHRYTTRAIKGVPVLLNKFFTLFIWACYVRKMKPDLISGHDLPGLLIGWISTWFMSKRRKPGLVYDSHEFEIGRMSDRTKLETKIIIHLEKFLIKRSDLMVVVNDSIADEVQRVYHLKTRPTVVRSTPENWAIGTDVIREKRQSFFAEFAKRTEKKIDYLMMFHGNLGYGNGIETLIPILSAIENVGLILMGQRNQKLYEELIASAEQYKVSDRMIIMGAVDYNDIWKYVGAVDIEMMLIEPLVRSYYYVLPNKMFESIQSLTPIIASNLPEMEKIVKQYRIGLTCEPGNAEEAINSVKTLCEDRKLYNSMKENLARAKEELCWENEKKVILKAYKEWL